VGPPAFFFFFFFFPEPAPPCRFPATPVPDIHMEIDENSLNLLAV
jgi:hypothetical protein